MKLSKRQLASVSRGGETKSRPCLDDLEIQRAALAELGTDERERVVDHLIECADCSEAVKVVRSLQDWAIEAVDSKRPPRFLKKPRLLAVAALFLIAIAAGVFWESFRPGVHDPEVQRGSQTTLQGLAPSPPDGAMLPAAPEVLSVSIVPGPDERFVVTLYDSMLAPIWRSEEDSSPTFALPESLRSSLGTGQRFHWRVSEVQRVSNRQWPLLSFELVAAFDSPE